MSAAVLGAALGAALAGALGERLGRRRALLLADAAFALGAAAQGAAQGVAALLLGRALVGLGVGVASAVVPLFIAECAPQASRGGLVTVNVMFITGGQLVAYASNLAFARLAGNWRWMLGAAALPALAQAAGLCFVPESPRWLMRCGGRRHEAADALARLREPDEARRELEAIEKELTDEAERVTGEEQTLLADVAGGRVHRVRPAWSELFSSPEARYALFVAAGLQAFQQLVGINTGMPTKARLLAGSAMLDCQSDTALAVMYYSAQILRLAGVGDNETALQYGLVISAGNVVGTVVGLLLIDRLGRRPLALWSLAGCFASLCVLALSFHAPRPDGALAFAGLCGYILCFSPGMGPVPWAVQSEVFPPRMRSAGTGVATFVNWAFNFAVAQTFLSMVDGIGKAGTFACFAGLTAVAFAFVLCAVPETKGLSLDEVTHLLRACARGRSLRP